MRPLLLLLFLILTLQVHSQIQEKYISRSTFNNSSSLTTIDEEIFINVSINDYFEIRPKKNLIIKLDKDLNLIDSLDLSGYDRPINNHFVKVFRILSFGNDTLVSIVSQHFTDSTNNGRSFTNTTSHLLFFDSNLNIYDTVSTTNDSILYNYFNLIKFDTKWIVIGEAKDTINFLAKPFITVLDSNLNSIETHFYPNLVRNNYPCGFVDIAYYENNFIARIEGSDRYFSLLDTNFNLLNNFNAIDPDAPNFYLSGYGEFIDIDQNSPIYMGTAYREVWGAIPIPPYFDTYWYMGVGKVDSTGKINEVDSLPLSGFNYRVGHPNDPYYELSPLFGFLDGRKPDSAVFAVAGQPYLFLNYTDSIANQIYIYNYNAISQQLNWLKVFESGVATSVYAQCALLPKNRFLIALNEYDWSLPYENLRVHLMILNGNGDILSEREFTSRGPKFIETYPNPFIDQVHVNLPDNDSSQRIHFELIDLFGKTIRSGILGETHTIEALENIPSGPYILHFSTEKGDTWISKVIKE